ncbi:hypothetical protein B0T26DRAFT_700806 [Lasiosphaeria miniovina]|uniref:Ribosomal protein S21 n=1 Tax=Lasiosphaeria miniovina TaxID=1954250 RepID=A0AA40AU32_9PEZI|nr:uncharacterized protein B0T26DRAFT_700806 [Lasiosphaeria miniovina]KAK0721962.1 hypothetical protein B0T26DRAFT_700806 [Lasiosphaeria miniovina]
MEARQAIQSLCRAGARPSFLLAACHHHQPATAIASVVQQHRHLSATSSRGKPQDTKPPMSAMDRLRMSLKARKLGNVQAPINDSFARLTRPPPPPPPALERFKEAVVPPGFDAKAYVPPENDPLAMVDAVMRAKDAGMMEFKTSDFLKKYNMEKGDINVRLKPSTGRSVPVMGPIDASRALRLLNRICLQNSVRRDSAKQKFHERPGLKRKRLRRERKRTRFIEGFRAVCTRVAELRRQGW